MRLSVTIVMMDIVKSRTIQQCLSKLVGDKADSQYSEDIYDPCHDRVDALLKAHNGYLHDAVGDQFGTYFAHARDALLFAVDLQRLMAASPIAVPPACGCPHLQLHVAVGHGGIERTIHDDPDAARASVFGDVARLLAITVSDQIL